METGKDSGQYRVWRALDADTSFFGIRGRFLLLLVITAAAVLAVTLMLWTAAGDLVGMVFGAMGLAASYFTVQVIQWSMSSRELERRLSAQKLTRYLKMRPISARQYLTSNRITWK